MLMRKTGQPWKGKTSKHVVVVVGNGSLARHCNRGRESVFGLVVFLVRTDAKHFYFFGVSRPSFAFVYEPLCAFASHMEVGVGRSRNGRITIACISRPSAGCRSSWLFFLAVWCALMSVRRESMMGC